MQDLQSFAQKYTMFAHTEVGNQSGSQNPASLHPEQKYFSL